MRKILRKRYSLDIFIRKNALLTPVRLREQSPTVELWAPDTALSSQLRQLVCNVAALVSQLEEENPRSDVWEMLMNKRLLGGSLQ